MKVATAGEMRNIDKAAVLDYGIPSVVLMENAGIEAAKQIAKILGGAAGKKVSVFAGKGSNGGDGYVAARHLANWGAKVKVFLFVSKDEISGDARLNLQIIENMGLDIIEVAEERDWDKAKVGAAFSDCLVDGLVGTGFHGELLGPLAEAADIINSAGKPVVAIDIPSGVHCDTGQIAGIAVRADYTVTFGLYKPGLLLYPGAEHAGAVVVADIGLPRKLLESNELRHNIITESYVRQLLPRRRADTHKGENGRVLIVAGSRGLSGAAALAASASMRVGAGLVTLAVPECIHDLIEIKLTEVMSFPLPDRGGAVAKDAVPLLKDFASRCQAAAVGPGLGTLDETRQAVRAFVSEAPCPLVLDADALNALAGFTEILLTASALPVITPHSGEMARLAGVTPSEINRDRIGIARQSAALWGSIVVLKGAHTVVAFPDGEVFINLTGNTGMATAGTGDVLTGIITGLIAQGLSSHDAAVAGVYIHGLAGDIAAGAGKVGIMAGDVLHSIPSAIKIIAESAVKPLDSAMIEARRPKRSQSANS